MQNSNLHVSVLNVDQQDSFGYSPLMLAVQHGHTDLTGQLLDHGANVLVRSNAGATALDIAARRGDVMVMRLIVQHGRVIFAFQPIGMFIDG